MINQQKQQMTYDTRNIVFFNNMSPSKAKGLPEALKRVVRVRNYLPLLSKVTTHTLAALKTRMSKLCHNFVFYSRLLFIVKTLQMPINWQFGTCPGKVPVLLMVSRQRKMKC